MTEEIFVAIDDVAKYFAVSVSTVRAWIRQGLIPALKLGGVYRFKLSEVEEALRNLDGGTLVREEADGSLTVEPPESDLQMVLNFNVNDDI